MKFTVVDRTKSGRVVFPHDVRRSRVQRATHRFTLRSLPPRSPRLPAEHYDRWTILAVIGSLIPDGNRSAVKAQRPEFTGSLERPDSFAIGYLQQRGPTEGPLVPSRRVASRRAILATLMNMRMDPRSSAPLLPRSRPRVVREQKSGPRFPLRRSLSLWFPTRPSQRALLFAPSRARLEHGIETCKLVQSSAPIGVAPPMLPRGTCRGATALFKRRLRLEPEANPPRLNPFGHGVLICLECFLPISK